MKETRFIDTSILLEILEVPDKCEDPKKYQKEFADFTTQSQANVIMPISVLVETGNHINHIKSNPQAKETSTKRFLEILKLFINSANPWFFYGYDFNADDIERVIEKYQELRYTGTGIGDIFILDSYNEYVSKLKDGGNQNHKIVIWTLDKHLQGYCEIL
ncbi:MULTISPECIES: hypothetical protein [Streptococcus]|uniref:hypothetical protein n=1 Tax=Streptococcus TaxID=1301 RepID=UPI0015676AC0|nr:MULTISPECIES: hypothetical protein [Streptococcus]MCY7070514.1 hypothetical protein [Streptococcus oralis]